MHLNIERSSALIGEISVPSDKSISHRAIMISSLANGQSIIENLLESEDCLNTVECFRSLGINIFKNDGGNYVVEGKGMKGLVPPEELLFVGNSGTTIRLILGILSGQTFQTTVTGDESIKKRPMLRVVEPLREMGASIKGRERGNFAPLDIKGGELHSIEYNMPVASAQVKSALMLASLFADGTTKITEPLSSRDHTEKMFELFSIPFKKEENSIFVNKVEMINPQNIIVPGDMSSAAFFIVAATIVPGSELKIMNVGVNKTRNGIITVLKQMGADIKIENLSSGPGEPIANIIVKYSELKGIEISGSIIPNIIDEIPIIAVAAACAHGDTVIKDAKELRVKESDRIKTITTELKKLGADVTETPDGMKIKGGKPFKSCTIESYGDHRIAMAMSVAALVGTGPVRISNARCIETSFPGFDKLMSNLSGQEISDQF